MSGAARVDTLIFGGGVAGLWTLRALLDAGVDAWLVETGGLGAAQSMQAQGIVHGGGKYALRRVGDVEAIRSIREMPARWRAHHRGDRSPSLEGVIASSDQCWLWLPRRSWRARLEGLTLMPLLRHGGLLACPPRARSRAEWPAPLRTSAHRAYSMDEPVFEPVSVIRCLADPVRDRLLRVPPVRPGSITRTGEGLRVEFGSPDRTVTARRVVACAGRGNADVLEAAGHDPARMQTRPLRMALLRGDLPALHGHCIAGGRTQMTITSLDAKHGGRVWQVGGEISERWASTEDEGFFRALVTSLRRALPALDLSGIELADYAAVRAEAANPEARRPSGVQVEVLEDDFVLAWPTKWAMAPILAEQVAALVLPGAGSGADPVAPSGWPAAELGTAPWEQATWRSASSVRPA